jgi:hypothetical protein
MRALVLTTIITVSGGGLIALAACGGSETTADPGEGGTSSSGGSSGSSGSDARNDNNTSSSGGSSGNPGSCNNLTQLGQQVNAQGVAGTRPTGTGGTVPDGTFVLVKANAYGLAGISQNIGAITIQRAGATAQAITTDNMGSDTHTATFMTSANNFSLTPTCSTAGDGGALNFQGTYTYGADASVETLTIYFDYDTGTIIGTVAASAEFRKQ